MRWFNGDYFARIIDPLATYIGLATFAVSVYIALRLTLGREWRFRRWRKEAISKPGSRPAAMIIDLIGKGAATDAPRYLAQTGVDIGDRIVTQQREGNILPEDIPAILDDFRKKLSDLSNMGADRIYLFMSAPTPVIAIIGAELANFGGVVLMHWNNQDGKYENWGPLRFIQ